MAEVWIRIFTVSILWSAGDCLGGVFDNVFSLRKNPACCDDTTTTTPGVPTPPDDSTGCDCPVDVAILWDRSGSQARFSNMEDFVGKLMRDFSELPCNASALITFDRNKAKLKYDFGHPASTNATLGMEIVQDLKRPKGQTRTGLALDLAIDVFNSTDNSDRCDVVVLLTDGGSDNKEETIAKALELQENSNAWVCLIDTHDGNYDSLEQFKSRRQEIEAIKANSAPNSQVIMGANFTAGVPDAIKNCICQSCSN